MADPVHPAGLVGDVGPVRQPGRDAVAMLLPRQHRLDGRAGLRRREGARRDAAHDRARSAAVTRLSSPASRAAASSMPRGSRWRLSNRRRRRTAATASAPTCSSSRSVARLPELHGGVLGEVCAGCVVPPRRVPGLVVLVVLLVQARTPSRRAPTEARCAPAPRRPGRARRARAAGGRPRAAAASWCWRRSAPASASGAVGRRALEVAEPDRDRPCARRGRRRRAGRGSTRPRVATALCCPGAGRAGHRVSAAAAGRRRRGSR